MKIVMPGGSGQIGTLLARAFIADGHEVTVLSRSPKSASLNENSWKVIPWDAKSLGTWCNEIENADVVINLAGRSVDCRYNSANRRAILESRVQSTRVIGQAIERATHPPHVWLQASTATIYAHRYDQANDEESGLIGGAEPGVPDTWRFSIEVAKAWEAAAMEHDLPKTRRVLLRSAMTMSPDRGGVFDVLSKLVRFRLGGRSGDGRQFFSWIHDQDFIRSIYWLIDHELDGAINLASPYPIPNEQFMRTLRNVWGVRFGLPANRAMLEIGAFFLRTEIELILKSRRVVPARLIESGFCFNFPTWEAAAKDLYHRWKS